MPPIRVLLADDHGIVREGLKRLLERIPEIGLVGEASDGQQAVEQAQRLQPDLVMMDVSMPRLTGVEATRQVKVVAPKAKVLALTVHEDEGYVRELFKAGASGYLLKRAPTEEVVRAIHVVSSGGVYIDPRVAGTAVHSFLRAQQPVKSAALDLSDREEEVLRLVAKGYANKEIAANLDLSVKTVDTYKARAMEKFSLRSRVDIVRLGIQRGWFAS